MPEPEAVAPQPAAEVSIDSPEVPFADYVKARREGKTTTTAIPAEGAKEPAAQEQEEHTEATEQPADAKPATESETDASSGKSKSKGGGFQRKIDKLTARTRQLESELEQARRGSTAQQPAQQQTQAEPAKDAQPTREQFGNNEAAYIDAMVGWRVRQELAQAEQKRIETERQESARQVVEAHKQRVSEARERHEDFDDALQDSGVIVQPATAVYIQRLENGPEVMYHLATNPDIAEEIQGLEEIDQIGALGHLSRLLSKGSEAKPRKDKPESRAPEPISPVAANTKSSPKTLDELSFMDYMKARRAGRSR
jgi:hypothetical protein